MASSRTDAAVEVPTSGGRLRWWARPSAVWWGFAVVHGWFLGWMASFFLHGYAFSDTEQYREWAMADYDAPFGQLVSPWVYPVLAQVPIRLPRIMGHDLYLLGWYLMIALLNAVMMWVLLHRGPRVVAEQERRARAEDADVAPASDVALAPAAEARPGSAAAAGWWWLLFTVFIGYLSFARVEGVAAPIMFLGLLWAVRRPAVGAALLSVATWIKVWPAAALISMVLVLRQRVRVVLVAAAVSAAVVLGVLGLGGIERIGDFLLNQGSRGMQLEATFSTPWLWLAVLHLAGSRIADNTAINSTEVYGPGVHAAAALMQPLLLLAVAGAAILLLRALRRGADPARLVYTGTLLLSIVLIVFNKVGSPQFMVWLSPVVVVGLLQDRARWRTPARLLLAIAITTFVIYPLFYTPLIHANPVMAAVLTVRNVLMVVLLCWTVRRLWQLGDRPAPVDQDR